jgi:hypothetical protein
VAKLTRANYDAIRDHLFDRIHKNGEQLKNDFPNILRKAIETEAWTQFTDGEGRPFQNIVDWLHYTFPSGASMGQGQHALTIEETLKLTEGASDVHRVLSEHASRKGRGRPGKEMAEIPFVKKGKNSPRAKEVLLAKRLAEEKPKIYDRYIKGDTSLNDAGRAAGLIKNDILGRAKSAFRNMTTAQRGEFLEWMKSEVAQKNGKK